MLDVLLWLGEIIGEAIPAPISRTTRAPGDLVLRRALGWKSIDPNGWPLFVSGAACWVVVTSALVWLGRIGVAR
jgi:hypothetical protein